RLECIQVVSDRAKVLGLSDEYIEPVETKGDFAIIAGRPFPKEVAERRKRLEELIRVKGFSQVMEEVAYTWFNRLCAIRYMELHDYLGHGCRVLSNPNGSDIPEILEKATSVELEGLDKDKIIELRLAGNKDAELYRMILVKQCNALNMVMPTLFEKMNDATELLLPENLLQTNSPIHKLVHTIPEEDWQHIEIVGWLYQFYISEKKDQVIGKVVKDEDIPAATQLFTPNWIGKYMVQNTLGRKWLMTYPDSPLKDKMEYYISPGEQTPEVEAQIKTVTPDELNPEELTFMDPACGSGHILAEAYDLFKEIYQERGYRTRDIPRLILEKNLFGLDIDDRAAQMARFTVFMKARGDDRRILNPEKPVRLNVMAIQESKGLDLEQAADVLLKKQVINLSGKREKYLYLINAKETQGVLKTEVAPNVSKDELGALLDFFHDAKTFGSLLRVPGNLRGTLPLFDEVLRNAAKRDDEGKLLTERISPLVRQAELLAKKYDFVVANPPYMGGKGQNTLIKKFLKNDYPDVKSDLFSAFIVRDLELAAPNGQLGFMSPFVWMFISSYEKLRTFLIDQKTLTSLIQLEYSGFEGATVPICTFTIENACHPQFKGGYVRLSDFKGAAVQGPKTLEIIQAARLAGK
ncbi:MAG: BREX-1 system adenine-specific DNA-methyltransferase PglX, partial [Desulfoplanes sp.]|nr:BREX-1 system adenine-specific DNA-methyltransferase PglX [Desulfoplanes sp.]